MNQQELKKKLSFDLYGRYQIIKELIDANRSENRKFKLLDVGGRGNILREFMPRDKVYYLDPYVDTTDDNYIQGDGCAIPLEDDSYDFVVSADVLEHIPKSKRNVFILEHIRVAKYGVVIAAPFYSPEIIKAEYLANEHYKKLFNKEHPWLKEHILNKLPRSDQVEKLLENNNYKFSVFNNNNLCNWKSAVSYRQILEKNIDENKERIEKFNLFYNQKIYPQDRQKLAYRRIYFIKKNGPLKDINAPINIDTSPLELDEFIFGELTDYISRKIKKDIDIERLSNKNNELIKENELQEEFIRDISSEIISLKEQLAKLTEHNRQIKLALANINNSRLWRILRPLIGFTDRVMAPFLYIFKNFQTLFDFAKQVYKQGGIIYLISRTYWFFIWVFAGKSNSKIGLNDQNYQYQSWTQKNCVSPIELLHQKKQSKKFDYQPKISIILPVYNTKISDLTECLESVINQSYQNWQLCIADDKSKDPNIRKTIKKYASRDKRIVYQFRNKNGHICQASNTALSLADGAFIGLLDHDDILWQNALYEVAKKLNENRNLDLIYSDEDKISLDGKTHEEPFFKPDWSPDYLRSINYITHFCVMRRSIVEKVGAFRVGYEGAQDWDLFIRITNQTNQIAHIPTMLYSWRKSPQSTAMGKYKGKLVKGYAYNRQKKILENDIKSKGLEGEVEQTEGFGVWHVIYKPKAKPFISIIIPSLDNYSLISDCIKSIYQKTTYPNFEVIVVDTGSKEKIVWNYYNKISQHHSNFRVINWKEKFNFSKVANFGAENTSGEILLFLNNDTQVISHNWLEVMVGHVQRKEIGSVGAKLLYPNKTIQFLGGILGINGTAGHAYRGIKDDLFVHFDKYATKNYSFITGACLMIRREVFNKLGGFDSSFKIAFNDIDLGLKIYSKLGLFNMIDPNVILIHKESATLSKPGEGNRDQKLWNHEIKLLNERWRDLIYNDPFLNKNLSRKREDFALMD